MQGVRLLGIGTQFLMQNLAGGTFIRVGTLIRQCIVLTFLLSHMSLLITSLPKLV